ncbi:uncharacterized protein BX664DRAFT_336179 [Halteromyces radiatus]|uniref:uncharacterized protein n=1 Tax=Halteromyces radiatus TaxID=101107 RepID=UPI00221EA569|nr:uncharacterized protein BX664DRAFT_336179 [Halteromyces radiatus]KAI8086575.1 hypothetical protein BX664DRAFT_336179 [Halteromyces radiatus]
MSFEIDTVSYALLTSIFGATAFMSLRNFKGPDIHPLLLNTQSDVSRLRHAGESAIYRSRMYPNGSPLLSIFDRGIRTLLDLYEQGGQIKQPQAPFLGQQNQWQTHESIAQQARYVYGGLREWTTLVPRSGQSSSFVGIYAYNSIETMTLTLACHNNGLVTVPMGAKSSSSHVDHVIKTTGLQVLAVDRAHVDQVMSLIKGTSVQLLIILDDMKDISGTSVEVVSLQDIVNKGKSSTIEAVRPEPTDIASIYFSSVLDSDPGVILTHKNLLSNIASYLLIIPPQEKITHKDRLMYNLPLDNVFGFVLSSMFSFLGGSIAFDNEYSASEHLTSYLDLVVAAKPTVFATGSGFFELVQEHIDQHYGNSFFFRRGYEKKCSFFDEGRLVTDSKYDMFVFRDIQRKLFGGQLRLIYLENDESDPPVAPFLRAVLGTQVLKVFNSAETSGTMTASMFYDYKADPLSFGAPLPCNELKLMDLPEKELYCDDTPNPRGEIWIRGNNVFQGYWNDPTTSDEMVDADGWYMTGVLGEIQPNGTLKLLGRK